jgi:peptidoglycan/xylan/chitin deacetylase (PgdA/CDA1 family)
METEYEATNDAVRDVVGHGMRYCRPPGGDNNFDTERAGATVGLRTVLWTDDPNDYVKPGRAAVLDYTIDHLTPGGIILLHDGVDQTIDVLPKMIHEIWKRGYRIVPLSDLPAGKV